MKALNDQVAMKKARLVEKLTFLPPVFAIFECRLSLGCDFAILIRAYVCVWESER
jgi:hypothetical protein